MSANDKLIYGYDPRIAASLGIALSNARGDFSFPNGEQVMKRLLKEKNPVAVEVHAERVRRRMGVLPLAYTRVSNDE